MDRKCGEIGTPTQIAGIAAAVLMVGLAIAWWARRTPRPVAGALSPDSVTLPGAISFPPLPSSTTSDGSLHVASVEELAKPWTAKKFKFVKPFTHESVEAMAIRLPGGALWAFALQEPFGRCQLEYVTDLPRLAKQYEYQASHPMVVNPCDGTIYDPTKVGSLGGDVWTRGEIVQGAASVLPSRSI